MLLALFILLALQNLLFVCAYDGIFATDYNGNLQFVDVKIPDWVNPDSHEADIYYAKHKLFTDAYNLTGKLDPDSCRSCNNYVCNGGRGDSFCDYCKSCYWFDCKPNPSKPCTCNCNCDIDFDNWPDCPDCSCDLEGSQAVITQAACPNGKPRLHSVTFGAESLPVQVIVGPNTYVNGYQIQKLAFTLQFDEYAITDSDTLTLTLQDFSEATLYWSGSFQWPIAGSSQLLTGEVHLDGINVPLDNQQLEVSIASSNPNLELPNSEFRVNVCEN